jgi:hypothetical protein
MRMRCYRQNKGCPSLQRDAFLQAWMENLQQELPWDLAPCHSLFILADCYVKQLLMLWRKHMQQCLGESFSVALAQGNFCG